MIKPWQVYYIFSPDTLPKPKYKYVAILRVGTSSCLYVLINTSVNDLIKNQGLSNCEVSISQADHDFLDHDSWIDCTGIFPYPVNDFGELQGYISENIREKVLEAVTVCDAIKNKYRKQIKIAHPDYFSNDS